MASGIHKPATPEELAAIARLSNETPPRSSAFIARELGIEEHRVRKIRIDHGLPMTKRNCYSRERTREKAPPPVVTPVAQPLFFAPIPRARLLAGR